MSRTHAPPPAPRTARLPACHLNNHPVAVMQPIKTPMPSIAIGRTMEWRRPDPRKRQARVNAKTDIKLNAQTPGQDTTSPQSCSRHPTSSMSSADAHTPAARNAVGGTYGRTGKSLPLPTMPITRISSF